MGIQEKKDKYLLVVSFFLISFIYFISSSHIVSSNDGSHYALTASLVEEGSVCINNFVQYTDIVDCARKDGQFYSDRSPGTALLAVPFYVIADFLQSMPINYFSENRKLHEVFIVFQANISALLGLFAFFNILLLLTRRFTLSYISTMVFAFGSLTWLEGTHLFSHASSMATMMWAVFLGLKVKEVSVNTRKTIFLIVLLLSYSSIIEIQNILFFPAFMLYFVITGKMTLSIIKEDKSVLLFSLVIFALIYSILIGFNYTAFHEITIKSNKYNVLFKEEKTFLSALSGNFLIGLDNLFFSLFKPGSWLNFAAVKNKTPGIFIATPVFLLAIPGVLTFYRRYKHESIFFISLIIPNVLIAAFHVTTLTRHIYTITPLIFIPFVIFLEKIFRNWNNEGLPRWRRLLYLRIMVLATTLSMVRVFIIIHGQWNRNIFNVFPFLSEIPSFFLMSVLIFLLICPFYHFKKMEN